MFDSERIKDTIMVTTPPSSFLRARAPELPIYMLCEYHDAHLCVSVNGQKGDMLNTHSGLCQKLSPGVRTALGSKLPACQHANTPGPNVSASTPHSRTVQYPASHLTALTPSTAPKPHLALQPEPFAAAAVVCGSGRRRLLDDPFIIWKGIKTV